METTVRKHVAHILNIFKGRCLTNIFLLEVSYKLFYVNHFIFIIIFYEDLYRTVSQSFVFLSRLFFVHC